MQLLAKNITKQMMLYAWQEISFCFQKNLIWFVDPLDQSSLKGMSFEKKFPRHNRLTFFDFFNFDFFSFSSIQ